MKDDEKNKKIDNIKESYRMTAELAYRKLVEKNNDFNKLTKKEIASLMFIGFQEFVDFEKMKKGDLVREIYTLSQKSPLAHHTMQNYKYHGGNSNEQNIQRAVAEIELNNQTQESVAELQDVNELDNGDNLFNENDLQQMQQI